MIDVCGNMCIKVFMGCLRCVCVCVCVCVSVCVLDVHYKANMEVCIPVQIPES